MSKPTFSSLMRQLNRFDRAADAYAFRGALFGHDEAEAAYEAVELEYEAAKEALVKSFRSLTE
ncbi:MAG: hypothetical protein HC888_05280 [Candidatus Competibacteraceae bacterium]|nr:hypothetical protein [Candidatus Competibacteraceae bacterium]